MLVLCKILRLFLNTLTDNDKYCLFYRENLTQPIQILLSQKHYEMSIKFRTFPKKITLLADVFPKLLPPNNVIR